MTCLSCAERKRLLAEARDAAIKGDLATARELLRQASATVVEDAKRLIRPHKTSK